MVAIAQKRMPPESFARLKTHTPLRHMQVSGLRYYSPELGRWVSRDPIGERGGVNQHLFVLNSPVSKYDLLGEIAVTSVGTPSTDLARCGYYYWAVRFTLGSRETTGWVVQHVTKVVTKTKVGFERNGICCCFPYEGRPITTEIWEAWRVKDGEVQNLMEVAGSSRSFWFTPDAGAVHDAYRFEGTRTCVEGNTKITGEVIFHRDDQAPRKQAPDGFIRRCPYSVSGGLPCTYNAPSWWNSSGAVAHNLEVEWKCCDRPYSTTILSNTP